MLMVSCFRLPLPLPKLPRLSLAIGSVFLSSVFVTSAHAQEKADKKLKTYQVCFVSFNNPKEAVLLENFSKRLNAEAKITGRHFVIKEYLDYGDNPRAAFEKMVRENTAKKQQCDGLVISGHHTGFFGGPRANGKLSVDDIEALSCKPEYMEWFAGVKSLWLQGCRTVGTGKMAACATPDILPATREDNPNYHWDRLAHHNLEGDGFRIAPLDINSGFDAVTSQTNPLGGRYIRAFSAAQVYGWTATAPGERSFSQLSIPHHIANLIDIEKGVWPEQKILTDKENAAIDLQLDSKNAQLYSAGFEKLLCGDNKACQAWQAHGNHKATSQHGFANKDLNSFEALAESGDENLLVAQKLNCELLAAKDDEQRIQALESALSNETLVGYSFNVIMNILDANEKTRPDFNEKIIAKLRANPHFSSFLITKLNPPPGFAPPSLVESIRHYTFWRDHINHRQEHPQIQKKIQQSVKDTLNMPNIPSGAHGLTESELYQRERFLADLKVALVDEVASKKLFVANEKSFVDMLLASTDMPWDRLAIKFLERPNPLYLDIYIKMAEESMAQNGDGRFNVSLGEALKRISELGAVAYPKLIPILLKHPNSALRREMAQLMASMKPKTPEQVKALSESAFDQNSSVRATLFDALSDAKNKALLGDVARTLKAKPDFQTFMLAKLGLPGSFLAPSLQETLTNYAFVRDHINGGQNYPQISGPLIHGVKRALNEPMAALDDESAARLAESKAALVETVAHQNLFPKDESSFMNMLLAAKDLPWSTLVARFLERANVQYLDLYLKIIEDNLDPASAGKISRDPGTAAQRIIEVQADAYPKLIPLALKHSNPLMRRELAKIMLGMQPRNTELVTALGRAMQDPDRGVRAVLIDSLSQPANQSLRSQIVATLGATPVYKNFMIKTLSQPTSEENALANAKQYVFLRNHFLNQQDQPEVRAELLRQIAKVFSAKRYGSGEDDKDAKKLQLLSDLFKLQVFKDGDSGLAHAVTTTDEFPLLGAVDTFMDLPKAKLEHLEFYLRVLQYTNFDQPHALHANEQKALAKVRELGAAAHPALIEILKNHPSITARYQAARFLYKDHTSSEGVEASLYQALWDKHDYVRLTAISGLLYVRTSPEKLVGEIEKMIDSSEHPLKMLDAVKWLADSRNPVFGKVLIKALGDRDAREVASRYLAHDLVVYSAALKQGIEPHQPLSVRLESLSLLSGLCDTTKCDAPDDVTEALLAVANAPAVNDDAKKVQLEAIKTVYAQGAQLSRLTPTLITLIKTNDSLGTKNEDLHQIMRLLAKSPLPALKPVFAAGQNAADIEVAVPAGNALRHLGVVSAPTLAGQSLQSTYPDASDRARAVRQVFAPTPQNLRVFGQALIDPSDEVKLAGMYNLEYLLRNHPTGIHDDMLALLLATQKSTAYAANSDFRSIADNLMLDLGHLPDAVRRDLASANGDGRKKVFENLSRNRSPLLVPLYAANLRASDAETQIGAIAGLKNFLYSVHKRVGVPQVAKHVSADEFRRILYSPNEEVRQSARELASSMEGITQPLLTVLSEDLISDDAEIQNHAAQLLIKLKLRTQAELLGTRFIAPEDDIRAAQTRALAGEGPVETAHAKLLKALDDHSAQIQISGIEGLAKLKHDPRTTLEALFKIALSDSRANDYALKAMAGFGAPAAAYIPQVVPHLAQRGWYSSQQILDLDPKTTGRLLLEQLRTSSDPELINAILNILSFGGDLTNNLTEEYTRELVKIANDDGKKELTFPALRSLEKINPAMMLKQVPGILSKLPRREISSLSFLLASMHDPAALSLLRDLSTHQDPEIRQAAIQSLNTADHIEILKELVAAGPDRDAREAILTSFNRSTGSGSVWVPFLLELPSKNPKDELALTLLSKYLGDPESGPAVEKFYLDRLKVSPSVPVVQSLHGVKNISAGLQRGLMTALFHQASLENPDSNLQRNLIELIPKKVAAPIAVPQLLQAIEKWNFGKKDKSDFRYMHALQMLATYQGEASSAAPHLLEVYKDPKNEYHEIIASALEQIAGHSPDVFQSICATLQGIPQDREPTRFARYETLLSRSFNKDPKLLLPILEAYKDDPGIGHIYVKLKR